MPAWESNKHVDLTTINNGNQFDARTSISSDLINQIVHELIYQYELHRGHVPNDGGENNGNMAG